MTTIKTKMTYEEFLLQKREGTLTGLLLEKKTQLKDIQKQLAISANLVKWLDTHGGVIYIDDPERVTETIKSLNTATLTGIDIETAKVGDHPMAGLLPEVSKVRLVQLWQKGHPCIVIDCYKAGTWWLEQLDSFNMLVAYNAAFEKAHLLHTCGLLFNIRCAMLSLRP